MSVISWNCQGIGNRETSRIVKTLISTHRPDILVLLEPKISGDKANKVCRELNFDDWVRVESVGYSGGVWLFWKSAILSLTVMSSSPQFIHCFVEKRKHDRWMLTATYGSPNVNARNLL